MDEFSICMSEIYSAHKFVGQINVIRSLGGLQGGRPRRRWLLAITGSLGTSSTALHDSGHVGRMGVVGWCGRRIHPLQQLGEAAANQLAAIAPVLAAVGGSRKWTPSVQLLGGEALQGRCPGARFRPKGSSYLCPGCALFQQRAHQLVQCLEVHI